MKPLRPNPALVDEFHDVAESIGATVEIDVHVYADTTRPVPKVTVTFGAKTKTVIRPTYRQCFAELIDWLTRQESAHA